MDVNEARQSSVKRASRAGLSILPMLPLLESGRFPRPAEEVADRLLCLTAVAAASYGLAKAKALGWLAQEHLVSALTDTERRFLERDEENSGLFQTQVEGMWALAWALGLISEMDFWKDCDDRFVIMLPNLKAGESGAELRRKSQMRPVDDLVSALDLAYCLHWVLRQTELDGKQTPLKPHLIAERRRALEWLLGDGHWDSISLDT